MSENAGQLLQLRRVRVNERHRCERKLKDAVKRHDEVVRTLDSLEQAVATGAARCERSLRARASHPADPAVGDYCRATETVLAGLRQRLEATRLQRNEAREALTAARKDLIRAEQRLEAIENRLREARLRERRRQQSRRDDDGAPQQIGELCEMPL